ncbi:MULTISPECIES: hypothetical protein [Bradyrhizobium]|uniref:hypothetical protein n=1 Tax=Bradyrhizobium TaxID=374 RepID=UPI0012F48F0E|nr:hypothetical protein [Bradyrhizobium sp. CCBAU 15544]
MPRPLFEVCRELNRNRKRGPSNLLDQILTEAERQLSSPARLRKELIARLGLTPLQQVVAAAAKPRRVSLTQQAIADLARQYDLAARVVGTSRPMTPVPPTKKKRKPGGGRHRLLTQEQINSGINLLLDSSRLAGMSEKEALRTLRDAGIEASGSTLRRHIIRPARSLARTNVKGFCRSK